MRKFDHRYMQLKYLEANSPRAPVAHRIEPLTGCIAIQTKKRPRSDEERALELEMKCRNYQMMLQNLLRMIHNYLKLSCSQEECTKKQKKSAFGLTT